MNTGPIHVLEQCAYHNCIETCAACPYASAADPCQIALAYDLFPLLADLHDAESEDLASQLRQYTDAYEGLRPDDLPDLPEDPPLDLFRRICDVLKERM